MVTTGERTSEGTTHHLVHQWDDETAIGERISVAIAECEGDDSTAPPPIEGSINPEALDELFDTTDDGDPRPGCVTFSYFGYTVVVHSTGRILIRQK